MLAQLGMKGPYELNKDMVESILEMTRVGNFALGKIDAEGQFIPYKVARSDQDLKKEVLSWYEFHHYTHFAYAYAAGPKQAYEKECQNYHDLFPWLKNPPHPVPPKDIPCKCPNQWCDR
jgi:hypothetical protein